MAPMKDVLVPIDAPGNAFREARNAPTTSSVTWRASRSMRDSTARISAACTSAVAPHSCSACRRNSASHSAMFVRRAAPAASASALLLCCCPQRLFAEPAAPLSAAASRRAQGLPGVPLGAAAAPECWRASVQKRATHASAGPITFGTTIGSSLGFLSVPAWVEGAGRSDAQRHTICDEKNWRGRRKAINSRRVKQIESAAPQKRCDESHKTHPQGPQRGVQRSPPPCARTSLWIRPLR